MMPEYFWCTTHNSSIFISGNKLKNDTKYYFKLGYCGNNLSTDSGIDKSKIKHPTKFSNIVNFKTTENLYWYAGAGNLITDSYALQIDYKNKTASIEEIYENAVKDGVLEIPLKIRGLKVIELHCAYNMFQQAARRECYNNYDYAQAHGYNVDYTKFDRNIVKKVIIPKGVDLTDYDFYETLEDIELVHVIKCGAFEDFRNLEEVKLPNDLEKIPPHTFRNCKINGYPIQKNKNLTIYGYKNSTAQRYAKENGIKFSRIK